MLLVDILLIAFSLTLISAETHFYRTIRTVIALKKVKGQYTNHLSYIEREMEELKKNIEATKTRSQQVEHLNQHASDDTSVDTSPNSKAKLPINTVVTVFYLHACN